MPTYIVSNESVNIDALHQSLTNEKIDVSLNNGTLLIDSDSFLSQSKYTLGNISSEEGTVNSVTISGEDVWEIPFTVTAGSESTDDFAEQTTLILNMAETAGATSIQDSTENASVFSAVGTASISNEAPSADSRSINLTTNTSYFESSQNMDAYNFGTGDFTIEFWYKSRVAGANYQTILECKVSGTPNTWSVFMNANGSVTLYAGTADLYSDRNVISHYPWPPIINDTQWHHVAVCRTSGTTRIFVNGVLGESVADPTNYTSVGVPSLIIGKSRPTTEYTVNGNIGPIRITKAGRYTTDFTPETTYPVSVELPIGVVPELGNITTNSVTGQTSNAVGEMLYISDGSGAILSGGVELPAAGLIKLRHKSADYFSNENIELSNGAIIKAVNPGKQSFIEVSADSLSSLTLSDATQLSIAGSWYELGVTNGTAEQLFALPVPAYYPAIQVETSVGSGVYEWWYNCGSLINADFDLANFPDRVFEQQAPNTLRLGRCGNRTSIAAVTGLRVRIPNVILTSYNSENSSRVLPLSNQSSYKIMSDFISEVALSNSIVNWELQPKLFSNLECSNVLFQPQAIQTSEIVVPTAQEIAAAVRAELSVELTRIDATVSSRATTTDLTSLIETIDDLVVSSATAYSQVETTNLNVAQTLVDLATLTEITHLCRKLNYNRSKIDSENMTLTIYDDDGVTPVRVFTLHNRNGGSSITEVFEKIPQ